MHVIISARGMTISKTYKDFITRKLGKLERIVPRIIEAKIMLSKEKHRRTAGLTLIAKNRTFRSEETAEDLAAAVDMAVEALRRQVREVKDRVKRHKTRRSSAPDALRGDATIIAEPQVLVRQVTPKPMSVEEAVDQFHLEQDQFLVFTNAVTDAVNVLYRRRDGGLGLIEPVA
jgi:putative sigma-54 modulation protein